MNKTSVLTVKISFLCKSYYVGQAHLDEDIIDLEDCIVNSIPRSSQDSEQAVYDQEKQNIRHLHVATFPSRESLSSRLSDSSALEFFNNIFYEYFQLNTGSQLYRTSSYVVDQGLCSDPEKLDSYFENAVVEVDLFMDTLRYCARDDDEFRRAMSKVIDDSTNDALKFNAIALLQARVISICIEAFRGIFGEAVHYHGPSDHLNIVAALVKTHEEGKYFSITVNYV
jgi:hypothetical protein